MTGTFPHPAVVALSPAALDTARRIVAALPGAILHGLTGRVSGADMAFVDTAGHLRALFAAGTPIIGVCAAGILIRALAPLLADKRAEPPVLAVAADGAVVVPLLGGHHGANRLATTLAAALGGLAAPTTAGETVLGVALDQPPPGWRIADTAAVKPVAAALLAGARVGLAIEAGNADWLAGLPFAGEGVPSVLVTDRLVAPRPDRLVFHPPVLALGIGCARGADPAEIEVLARQTLAAAGLAAEAVACVVSVDVKADEPAVQALADSLGVPARFFSPERLEAETPRLATPSDVVFEEIGCHGVAEAAALAAAGPDSLLIVPKAKTAHATCAVARAPEAIDPAVVGAARGRLFVLGTGPGDPAWRVPEVDQVLAGVSDVVGYGLYLDLLGPAIDGKARHQSDLGEEEARARRALDLAAEGRSVALVCSGDPGIYALATLVFELLDRADEPAWNRVAVRVVPGVSALQAAAARIGAPINHDFCTISLSDLLTPWEVIERRLRAAADGDFVVALYNPVSRRRRRQLEEARTILLGGRPPETPVVLARNLGRPGETVVVTALGQLSTEMADMLTVVLIGNRESRAIRRGGRTWVYTPRGYASKMG